MWRRGIVALIVVAAVLCAILSVFGPQWQTDVNQRRFWFGYIEACRREWKGGLSPNSVADRAYADVKRTWPYESPDEWSPSYGSALEDGGLRVYLQYERPARFRRSALIPESP